MRAASEPYAHLIGEIELEEGEGLAWWALERGEPAFIRENSLEDRRNKYVPELEEERFQSLVSVPILGKDRALIGVITMHTEAPREFAVDEVEFLVSSASLVAGAIENARLYEQMGQRVRELEHLTELGEDVAAAERLDELGPLVVRRALDLLGASAVHLYLAEHTVPLPAAGCLVLRPPGLLYQEGQGGLLTPPGVEFLTDGTRARD